jgi:hypothetical protein
MSTENTTRPDQKGLYFIGIVEPGKDPRTHTWRGLLGPTFTTGFVMVGLHSWDDEAILSLHGKRVVRLSSTNTTTTLFLSKKPAKRSPKPVN